MRRESLDLIFALIKNRNRKFTLSDLSDYFGISERAVRYELDHANSYLESRNNQKIVISESKTIIHELNPQVLEKVIEEISSNKYLYNAVERQSFIIMNVLKKEGIKFAYIWAEELEVSKSTIDSDVRQAKKIVETFNLKLESNGKNGYVIIGDEWAKRSLFHHLALINVDVEDLLDGYINADQKVGTIYDVGTHMLLEFIDIETLFNIYKTIFEEMCSQENQTNQIKIIQLSILISIWLSRVQDGFLLESNEVILNKYNKIHVFEILETIKQKFISDYSSLNYYEDYYVSYYFDGYEIEQNTKLKDDWANIQVLTINFINHVEKLMGIRFSSDEELFKGLYEHIKSLSSRLEKKIVITNPLELMIKAQYATVFEAVSTASQTLEEYFEYKISDSELSYIAIHFSASKEKMLQDMKKVHRVAIICGHGVATGELLSENIKKAFPVEVVAILEMSALKNIKSLDIDFAVSTIDVQLDGIKTITVNPMLREIDKKEISMIMLERPIKTRVNGDDLNHQLFFNQIAKLLLSSIDEKQKLEKLEEIFTSNGLMVHKEGVQPMIHEVLDKDKIQIKKEVEDWETAIKIAARPLLLDGTINDNYVQSMIASVKDLGPYIVLDKGIALAHATPGNDVSRLGLSVLTLENPINFGHSENDPVEIVFCLAAVDGYSHLKIMKTLVNVINERWKLDSLINAKDKEEFLKLVTRYEHE